MAATVLYHVSLIYANTLHPSKKRTIRKPIKLYEMKPKMSRQSTKTSAYSISQYTW